MKKILTILAILAVTVTGAFALIACKKDGPATGAPAAPSYNVTVETATGGTVQADKASAKPGEAVTITAAAQADYLFEGFIIDKKFVAGELTEVKFNMPSQDVTVGAKFAEAFDVAASPENAEQGTVIGAGKYKLGQLVNLIALNSVDGYAFEGWYADGVRIGGAGASYVFELNEANLGSVYVAKYIEGYTLTVTNVGGNAFAGSVSGGSFYAAGQQVPLTATVNGGYLSSYTFEGWYVGGTKISGDANYIYTTTAAEVTINAEFRYGQIYDNFTHAYAAGEIDENVAINVGAYGHEIYVQFEITETEFYFIASDTKVTGYNHTLYYDDAGAYVTKTGAFSSYDTVIFTHVTLEPGTYYFRQYAYGLDYVDDDTVTLTVTPVTERAINVISSNDAWGDVYLEAAAEYYVGYQYALTASETGGFFDGWYIDGELVSISNTYTYLLWDDVTIEGRFAEEAPLPNDGRREAIVATIGTPYAVNTSVSLNNFFKFTVNTVTNVRFYSTNNSGDPYGELYIGANLQRSAYDDDSGDNNFSITYELQPGTVYFVNAKSYNGSAGVAYDFIAEIV
ncbi:MAG: hypothetical protein LBN25_00095 [Christensenellaceae bacterium]|jgi:hypothetical protein|nr:hypothetical protein [Christensenellaceae bacterium]